MSIYIFTFGLFALAFGICAVLWCLLAFSGQLDDQEERQDGVRRS